MRTSSHITGIEKGAFSDLWRNTLSNIPSLFGRLVYLAATRDPDTGKYHHHGLALLFGEEETNKALRKSHAMVFADWINFNLEEQKADIDLYIAALVAPKRTVLDSWTRLEPYKALPPSSLRPVERRLYLADFDALLGVLRNEFGVASADPDA